MVDRRDNGTGQAAKQRTDTAAVDTGSAAADITLDCDSDELEALEDAADVEDADEEELDRIMDEAASVFPPGRVEELMSELKQHGLVHFMQNHLEGVSAVRVRALLVALGVLLPRGLREADDVPLPYLVALLKTALSRQLRRREKLAAYNTVEDALDLLRRSKRIMVLGGAGISTSCGIPDFRSKDGIYTQLQREGKYDLSDPQDMFDKDFFLHDPSCFFSFAKAIFPSNFVPSPSHRFIRLLEEQGKLLRHYTQNIDTLEDVAGIRRVLHCHGSFSKAACTTPGCGYTVPGSEIKQDIFAQRVPHCPRCRQAEVAKRDAIRNAKPSRGGAKWEEEDDHDSDGEAGLPGLGVMKPCITFFGEKLSDEFDRCVLADREEVDLLVVMGTSLKVAPVSELVGHIPHSTPVLLINRTPVVHLAMDIQLLGNADLIVEYLCRRLDWTLPLPQPVPGVVGKESAAGEMADEEDMLRQNADIHAPVSDIEPERLGDR